MKIKEAIEKVKGNISLILGLIAAIQAVIVFVKPMYEESPMGKINRLLEDMEVYGKVVQAETDIDVYVHDKYGLELYHCNKDNDGHFKYSFIRVGERGRPKEAKYSRVKRCWVYDNNGEWTPIRQLKK
jgi:hypothetical protein